jgi:hypothetical protein
MSGRHTGGVKGTTFLRADCPVCGRDTAGGNASQDRRTMMLKPHNNPAGERCSGSKMLVTPRCYL